MRQAQRKLIGLSAPVRQGLRSQFHALRHRCRQRTSLRVVALGQCLRHFAAHIATTMGAEHGERVRSWFQAKKAGWYTMLADPQMPASSTLLDQAHQAIDRKRFAMKGFHHPRGSQAAFLTGLAHLYNLIPYQGYHQESSVKVWLFRPLSSASVHAASRKNWRKYGTCAIFPLIASRRLWHAEHA